MTLDTFCAQGVDRVHGAAISASARSHRASARREVEREVGGVGPRKDSRRRRKAACVDREQVSIGLARRPLGSAEATGARIARQSGVGTTPSTRPAAGGPERRGSGRPSTSVQAHESLEEQR